MKKIRAIPADRLCPHCHKGRLILEGLRRCIVIGEFSGKGYRKCDRCGERVPRPENFVGVEEEEKKDTSPGLYDHLPDDSELDMTFRHSESNLT